MGRKKDLNCPNEPNVVDNSTTNSNIIYNRNIINYPLSIDTTLERGYLLGIMRPVWIRNTESEERLRWFRLMIGKNLLVRDIEAFLQSTCEKLRSEESVLREEERKVFMRLMVLKRNDERRHLRKQKKEKENLRRCIQEQYGKRKCYNLIVKYLRKEVRERRTELRKKYEIKIKHLYEIRQKEIKDKKKKIIPEEISYYRKCLIFNEERLREKIKEIEKEEQEDVCIGKVTLDADEKAVLRLNPKFAVTKYLDEEEIERDIELGEAKLRYEIRKQKDKRELEEYEIGEERKKKIRKTGETSNQTNIEKEEKDDIEEARERLIFDPTEKEFDYSKRRTTDLKENTKVTLPKAGSPREEAELEMIRKVILDEFNKFKREKERSSNTAKARKEVSEKRDKDKDKDIKEEKIERKDRENRNQESENLTESERRGLNKLRKRIKNDELVILRTDKSGKLAAMNKEDYLKMGLGKIKKDTKR